MLLGQHLRRLAIKSAEEIISVLSGVERVDSNVFRSMHPLPESMQNAALYGGQLVSQAMMACMNTVPDWLQMHSIQCSFLKRASLGQSVLYFIERNRDGRTFSTRSVKALQDGQCILLACLSFHKETDCVVEHQANMPNVPLPESVDTWRESSEEHFSLLGAMSDYFQQKPVKMDKQAVDTYGTPLEFLWLKASNAISDDLRMNQCFASQITHNLMFHTAMKPFKDSTKDVSSAIATDHCDWFHYSHLNFGEWVLSERSLNYASGTSGFSHCRLWSKDGQLLVSAMQETTLEDQVKKTSK
ncbi:acyl coenzyme A thioesterase II [Trichuris trichiura]|uniref:Acyl coenzyme A thioesterase II n=1 Tax=Trichuris trichiura TaxID=36087 RepID=A0A077Z3A8_TRITR|nr:acyl coenzyme A thioesterase II [Trichuris trichiura]